MKKIAIIAVTLFFCLPLFINAQEASEFKPFSFGLKAIPSISFLKTESKDFKNGNAALNFGYGLMAEFNFAPNYGMLTGIEINDNRGNVDYINTSKILYFPEGDTVPFYLQSRKYNIKYLNIPVLLKLKTNEIGFLKYFGQFGVDAGFRLKARATDEGLDSGKVNVSVKEDVNVDKDVNLIRLALNVGAGVEWNLSGSTSVVVGLNYSNCFTNYLKKESYNLQIEQTGRPWLKQSAYNNYVALTLGILF